MIRFGIEVEYIYPAHAFASDSIRDRSGVHLHCAWQMNTETLRIRHHLLDEDLADVADVLVVERSLYSRFLQQ